MTQSIAKRLHLLLAISSIAIPRIGPILDSQVKRTERFSHGRQASMDAL